MRFNSRQTKKLARRPLIIPKRSFVTRSELESNETREEIGDTDDRVSKMYQIGDGL